MSFDGDALASALQAIQSSMDKLGADNQEMKAEQKKAQQSIVEQGMCIEKKLESVSSEIKTEILSAVDEKLDKVNAQYVDLSQQFKNLQLQVKIIKDKQDKHELSEAVNMQVDGTSIGSGDESSQPALKKQCPSWAGAAAAAASGPIGAPRGPLGTTPWTPSFRPNTSNSSSSKQNDSKHSTTNNTTHNNNNNNSNSKRLWFSGYRVLVLRTTQEKHFQAIVEALPDQLKGVVTPRYRNGRESFPIDCDSDEDAKLVYEQLKEFAIQWYCIDDNTTKTLKLHPDTPYPIRLKKKLIGAFWAKIEDHLNKTKLMQPDMKLGATFSTGTLWIAEGETIRPVLRINLDSTNSPSYNYNGINLNRYKLTVEDMQLVESQQLEALVAK